MDRSKIDNKASLIWSIADKLQGDYKPHEYGEVILPFTVLKRFDSVLKDTKEKVLKVAGEYSIITPPVDKLLKNTTKQGIYNISKFDFQKLLADPDNIKANFINYINGFSEEVKDIMEKFEFERQLGKLADIDLLYLILQEFNSEKAELHPDKVSNIEMGYIFEEIIRKFSETYNEDAGEFYTPREVIDLMVDLLFENQDLKDDYKAIQIYDGACGTGGMLSVAYEYIKKLNNTNEIFCHGQESNPQTYAICKSDMLLKGQEAYIKHGNTLSGDCFSDDYFDYIIMNPPFGREWKKEKDKVVAEYKKPNNRFQAGLPAISDSQLLFLQNAVSKMKPEGSKIAIIHNGSALFRGDAGSGESEIRKYVLENDLLDCIVQLPNDIFYNTGIATYIWLLSNKKEKERINKVQLIDAKHFFQKRKKSLGNKRNDISPTQIKEIVELYNNFKETKRSKIFDVSDFGFNKVTVEQPLLDENGQIIYKKDKIQPNKELTDTENIPLKQDINEYIKREVLPFAPNSYVDYSKIKVGYEIPFTKHFYEFEMPRKTDTIKEEILEIDKQLDSTLRELFK